MKKLLSLLLAALLLVSASSSVFAENEITVNLDGRNINFDVAPQIINGRTMVPLRAIFEALGSTVNWDSSTRTVIAKKSGTTVSLTIDSSSMTVNDSLVSLDSPACIIEGRTLVPVRAVSEAFGTNVNWNANTRTVTITSAKKSTELTEDEISVKLKANGSALIIENRSDYAFSFNAAMINDSPVFEFKLDGKKTSNVIINPGEKKVVQCMETYFKIPNYGVDSYGHIVIVWQGEQYYAEFTVNGITTFYKGNVNGPAN